MFTTKYYTIRQLPADDPDEFCWAIVHREYGTVEHKSYTLPGAITVCKALSEQLDEFDQGATLQVVE